MDRRVRTAVLYGGGLNCDIETAHAVKTADAFGHAGAEADRVLLGRLMDRPDDLLRYDILAIPGGFSYADDLGAGVVLANKLKRKLGEQLYRFIEEGRPVIGICNGYQALVKGGFLPGLDGERKQQVTLTYNDSGRFEDRWVTLEVTSEKCIFTKDIDDLIDLPVRHGEGKFVAANCNTLTRLRNNDMIVFKYVSRYGEDDPGYPENPNGSEDDIAAICNERGNVLGIMPHPEGYMFPWQHPRWTREGLPEEGLGMQIFRNAVKYVRESL
ncbi:MAG: phosphoribosylformylglycinamidine synthase I [Candidatus Aenigmarchaeota archaeon]|nr:phosphoribosylformylglycinamidine synthase I [Candidatus Aenigmarchaeota archaeon]